jgi:hypothetical protein
MAFHIVSDLPTKPQIWRQRFFLISLIHADRSSIHQPVDYVDEHDTLSRTCRTMEDIGTLYTFAQFVDSVIKSCVASD